MVSIVAKKLVAGMQVVDQSEYKPLPNKVKALRSQSALLPKTSPFTVSQELPCCTFHPTTEVGHCSRHVTKDYI
jgi:hypothetical protein